MASAVKKETRDLSSAAKTSNPAPIDISSDSDSSSNSADSSDVEEDQETIAFIESITSKSRTERNPDEAPPAKKLKRGGETALGFPVLAAVTAAVPLRMTRVLPDSTCVTQKIGQNSNNRRDNQVGPVIKDCKQFWKAGDYEGDKEYDAKSAFSSAGMDHARIHPKFLHSNATSHKWALGLGSFRGAAR